MCVTFLQLKEPFSVFFFHIYILLSHRALARRCTLAYLQVVVEMILPCGCYFFSKKRVSKYLPNKKKALSKLLVPANMDIDEIWEKLQVRKEKIKDWTTVTDIQDIEDAHTVFMIKCANKGLGFTRPGDGSLHILHQDLLQLLFKV